MSATAVTHTPVLLQEALLVLSDTAAVILHSGAFQLWEQDKQGVFIVDRQSSGLLPAERSMV